MPEVFISYSHKDDKIREQVCQKLEANGISCWYAPRDIEPGAEWADTINKALAACKVVVLIFTENSNSSDQVIREVGLAVDYKKTIIPFQCDDTLPSGSMKYYLSTLHWMNGAENMDAALDGLLALTQKSLAGEVHTGTPAKPKSGKKFTLKQLLLILAAIVVLNAAVIFYLRSQGIFHKPADPVQIAEDSGEYETFDDLYNALANGTLVLASGEDYQSADLNALSRTVVMDNKLYYFNPDLDSQGAEHYLISVLEDNTIQLNQYQGTAITDLVIPEIFDGLPVVEIGESCFENNTEIVKVTLPKTVDTIGDSAFAGCENLNEIIFSENLLVIGFEAFAESGLKNVILPDSVKDLGEAAFFGCPKLESVFLPESVKLIPFNTFVNTPALKSVTIAAEKALIDKDAFTAADGLTLNGVPDSSTQNYAEKMGIDFAPYEKK